MPNVLIRNVDPSVLDRLRSRAKRHGRSLQAELRTILEAASQRGPLQARRTAGRIRRALAGRAFTDSGSEQASDRTR